MNCFRLDVSFGEQSLYLIGSVFGTGKNQRGFYRLILQDMHQQVFFICRINKIHFLLYRFGRSRSRSYFHLFGIGKYGGCQRTDGIGHGSREKQRLTFSRNNFYQFLHIVNKPHIEHAVCFVQHKNLQVVQLHIALVVQIEQTSRSGNKYIYTCFEGTYLIAL